MVQITQSILLISLLTFSPVENKLEPFIVGGDHADITKFPHSVFIKVLCDEIDTGSTNAYICGGSVINQKVTLTAAHCLYDCKITSDVAIIVGHIDRDKGAVSSMHSFVLHEYYDPRNTVNDIGLVKLKSQLKLNDHVKRIALMKDPPYFEKAQVAGWGMINEETKKTEKVLNYIDQYVWATSYCQSTLHVLPPGVICASSSTPSSYSSRGDSGSALVVKGYIQIGLVSYKVPQVSKSLVVYTDVGYFFDWIQKTSSKLYCT